MRRRVAGFLFLLLLTALPVHAKERVALVIGNAAYADAPLENPINDAVDMAATLEALDFEVIRHTNLDRVDMHKAIQAFGGRYRNDRRSLAASAHRPRNERRRMRSRRLYPGS